MRSKTIFVLLTLLVGPTLAVPATDIFKTICSLTAVDPATLLSSVPLVDGTGVGSLLDLVTQLVNCIAKKIGLESADFQSKIKTCSGAPADASLAEILQLICEDPAKQTCSCGGVDTSKIQFTDIQECLNELRIDLSILPGLLSIPGLSGLLGPTSGGNPISNLPVNPLTTTQEVFKVICIFANLPLVGGSGVGNGLGLLTELVNCVAELMGLESAAFQSKIKSCSGAPAGASLTELLQLVCKDETKQSCSCGAAATSNIPTAGFHTCLTNLPIDLLTVPGLSSIPGLSSLLPVLPVNPLTSLPTQNIFKVICNFANLPLVGGSGAGNILGLLTQLVNCVAPLMGLDSATFQSEIKTCSGAPAGASLTEILQLICKDPVKQSCSCLGATTSNIPIPDIQKCLSGLPIDLSTVPGLTSIPVVSCLPAILDLTSGGLSIPNSPVNPLGTTQDIFNVICAVAALDPANLLSNIPILGNILGSTGLEKLLSLVTQLVTCVAEILDLEPVTFQANIKSCSGVPNGASLNEALQVICKDPSKIACATKGANTGNIQLSAIKNCLTSLPIDPTTVPGLPKNALPGGCPAANTGR